MSFCRSMAKTSDEFVHPALDRTYLVSTSPCTALPAKACKPFTCSRHHRRREAERRYRELFDNIQEGLFFSTPEGRFIEVNDALVSYAGLFQPGRTLQVDIPTQIYFSGEQRKRHAEALEKDGHLRNFDPPFAARTVPPSTSSSTPSHV